MAVILSKPLRDQNTLFSLLIRWSLAYLELAGCALQICECEREQRFLWWKSSPIYKENQKTITQMLESNLSGVDTDEL